MVIGPVITSLELLPSLPGLPRYPSPSSCALHDYATTVSVPCIPRIECGPMMQRYEYVPGVRLSINIAVVPGETACVPISSLPTFT